MALSQNDSPLSQAAIRAMQAALLAAMRMGDGPAVKALTVALSTIDPKDE